MPILRTVMSDTLIASCRTTEHPEHPEQDDMACSERSVARLLAIKVSEMSVSGINHRQQERKYSIFSMFEH